MKHKKQTLFPISLMLGLFLIFTPFSILTAQEEDDAVEEIFWGDEEEDAELDEEFDFSEDEELGDEDFEGFEFWQSRKTTVGPFPNIASHVKAAKRGGIAWHSTHGQNFVGKFYTHTL